jgi:large subunit ribosomal protein L23
MNLSYVIVGPVVTEKSMKTVDSIGAHSLYVHSDATKDDVKSALKKFYGVHVSGVTITKLPTKTRVRGRHGPQIKRKTRKKAIVRLQKNESLDLLKLAPLPKQKKVVKNSPEASADEKSKTSVKK